MPENNLSRGERLALFESMVPACRVIVGRTTASGHDYEDLMQVAMLTNHQCSLNYDQARLSPKTGLPVPYSTYAWGSIATSVRTARYKQLNGGFNLRRGLVKERRFQIIDEDVASCEDAMPDDGELVSWLLGMLPEMHRDIVTKRFFEGKSLKVAGAEIGVSREWARKVQQLAISDMKRMLRDACVEA
jgi:DNA-directed RNA polymerase specialized sigma subunit